jgi:hypothetical protein
MPEGRQPHFLAAVPVGSAQQRALGGCQHRACLVFHLAPYRYPAQTQGLLEVRAPCGEQPFQARVLLHDLAVRRDRDEWIVGRMATVTLPVDIALLVGAARGLGPEHGLAGNADSVAVLAVLGGVRVLWLVTWWRNGRSGRRV